MPGDKETRDNTHLMDVTLYRDSAFLSLLRVLLHLLPFGVLEDQVVWDTIS